MARVALTAVNRTHIRELRFTFLACCMNEKNFVAGVDERNEPKTFQVCIIQQHCELLRNIL
jgi:hypothetical protein